jgi:hypothetical protein
MLEAKFGKFAFGKKAWSRSSDKAIFSASIFFMNYEV